MKYRSLQIKAPAIDKSARSVDVIASTDALDAYGERVTQDFDLARYKANPVVLWNHNLGAIFSGPQASLPIGYARNVGVRDGQLEATLVFVDEAANPLAELVWQGFLQNSIHAVSIGFNPGTVATEKENGQEYVRLSQNELYEISVTCMGANADAVARARARAKSLLAQRVPEPASEDRSRVHCEQGASLADLVELAADDDEDDDFFPSQTPSSFVTEARRQLSANGIAPTNALAVRERAQRLELDAAHEDAERVQHEQLGAELERRRALGITEGQSRGGDELAALISVEGGL